MEKNKTAKTALSSIFSATASIKAICFACACCFMAQIACRDAVSVVGGLRPPAPTSFIKENETEWTVIPISAGLTPARAWAKSVEAVSAKYDTDLLDHNAHHLRTIFRVSKISGKWGAETQYRTRVMLRLGPDQDRLLLKVEARFGSESEFDIGTDTNVLERLKQDINGALGSQDGNF